MFERVEGLDVNHGDEVFHCAESGRYIKTRVLRIDDSGHPADIRAKNIFIHVSGSACDEFGKALPDGAGGHCIAPEKAITLSIPELQREASEQGISLGAAIKARFTALRLDCCNESAGIDEAIALKMLIPVKAAI